MSADENDLLDGSSGRNAQSHLSCQIPFSDAVDEVRVTIAAEDRGRQASDGTVNDVPTVQGTDRILDICRS